MFHWHAMMIALELHSATCTSPIILSYIRIISKIMAFNVELLVFHPRFAYQTIWGNDQNRSFDYPAVWHLPSHRFEVHKTKGFKQACDIEDSSEAEGSGQRVSRKEVFGPQDDGDVDVKVSENYSTARLHVRLSIRSHRHSLCGSRAFRCASGASCVIPITARSPRTTRLGVNAYGLDLRSGIAGRSHLLRGGEAARETKDANLQDNSEPEFVYNKLDKME
ncbi:uncharacterized protein LACBIDRAFT_320731 [Laccaria bicolor S238N-H82]|uniref:Predicted protein n=1 Tax=Laccaria bicolor (strain S238N-H82 / ATCC MYA-4686) TaxID=486041 RepID=B0CR20_LACBS|nr:uncharacterized protein LACBIDRAFT_320731 [Laccaria bicolor S238N-H82]EDR15125.1 predicted protein [Laccaria bicolor S238N-H82]|eukprot:XP_001873333.1 predicted protein [Laccaria bicolor S238N-H82]